jgi:hypothetical protein
MSNGSVGNGVSYYVNIKISGDLDKAKLETVKGKIKAILDGSESGQKVDGKIVGEARVSDNNSAVTLNVTY